ncbi:hypothetical protein [Crenothrix sp.]|uniref:hypothetical protein n=1 Tax=Crenothrix sp. TaxID=3100433 RepID=UPI00374D1CD0
MSPAIQEKFYSFLPLLRLYAKFLAILSCLFFVVAIIGQWHSGRFPACGNLAFAVLIPMMAFVVIAILVLLSDYLYPLKISATGLYSYNCLGCYQAVTWKQIVSVEEGERFGLKCLYVDTNTVEYQFIVPLYLHDFNGFCLTVEQYAGNNNPLAMALKNIADQNMAEQKNKCSPKLFKKIPLFFGFYLARGEKE